MILQDHDSHLDHLGCDLYHLGLSTFM